MLDVVTMCPDVYQYPLLSKVVLLFGQASLVSCEQLKPYTYLRCLEKGCITITAADSSGLVLYD